jgi:hypothetical protein
MVRRRLTSEEKREIATARYAVEKAASPDFDVEIVVSDYAHANGEPDYRVIRHAGEVAGKSGDPDG